MLSYAGKRLWERERVPRTCDQTINDRVQIDFRVPHKDFAGVRTGLGNRVRVLLRSAAAASVLENPQEIERVCVRERERKKTKAAGWKERKVISTQWRVPMRVFRYSVVPLPLATAPTGSAAGQRPE